MTPVAAQPVVMPVAGANVSAAVQQLLADRGIDYQPGRQITAAETGMVHFGDTSASADHRGRNRHGALRRYQRIGKPLPRAGVFAHAQAHVVADTITADITGKPAPAGFDGHGGCVIETGSGRAAYGSSNSHGDPAPTVALHSPARRWHWGKVTFEQRVMRRWL